MIITADIRRKIEYFAWRKTEWELFKHR
jgi:hypothetical protein